MTDMRWHEMTASDIQKAFNSITEERDRWRNIADKLAEAGGCWTCDEWMEIGEFSHGDPEKPHLCKWRVALYRYEREVIRDS